MSKRDNSSVGLTTGLISAFNRIGQEAKGNTGKEILRNAGMDFRVEKTPLFDSTGTELKCGYSRLSRNDTGQTLGVVSNKYKVFQNQEMMNLFEEVCHQSGAKIDRIGMVNGGEKVFMSFRQPEGFSFGDVGNAEEQIDAYWYLISSHDASTGLKLFPSPVRLACSNQFGMLNGFLRRNGVDPRKLTIRHSNLMNVRVDEMLENLNMVNHLTQAFVQEAAGLINIEMEQNDRIEYYIDVLGLTQKDEMLKGGKDYDANNPYGLGTRANNTLDILMELEKSDTNNVGDMAGTRWQAFNTVTEYIDHRWTMDKEGKDGLTSNNKRVESAVIGPGMRMKNRAYELLTV
ncbi:MAG: hypothetical protein CMC15_13870 [Flavobacteriaceae bacterium]|nr:hypothetical protein [Flavobacteriaceae bacterium]